MKKAVDGTGGRGYLLGMETTNNNAAAGNTMSNAADRFDFTNAERAIFTAAITLGILDATSFAVMGLNGLTADEMIAEILDAAWADRHGSDNHKVIGRMRDERYKAIRDAAAA